MTSSKVSSLTEKTTLDKDDLLYISSGAADFKTKVSTFRGVANLKDYGGIADCRILTDGAMTVAQNIITSASAPFTIADVGKLIDIEDAGLTVVGVDTIAVNNNLAGTITAFLSTTQVQVSFVCINTVVGKKVTYGTSNTTVLLAAKNSGKPIYIPQGNFAISITEIPLLSNQSLYGDGQGVSVLTVIGSLRGSGGQLKIIRINDGIKDVNIFDLSILGTNYQSLRIITGANYTAFIRLGTGAGGNIENITIQRVELGYIHGMGCRSDGDIGQTPGVPPAVLNIKVLDSYIHHCSDNGININNNGGLVIAHNRLVYNGAGGAECANERLQVVDNYIAYNRTTGIALGGLGNPSLGKDTLFIGNLVERNGNFVSNGGGGVVIGANTIHAIISNNIVRENASAGIIVVESDRAFSSLSRNIRISNNQIISNGYDTIGSSGVGIVSEVDDVVIESNDFLDDNVTGFTQHSGIYAYGNNLKLVRNTFKDHINQDIACILSSNNLFVTEQQNVVLTNSDVNSKSGSVDTNGTVVSYKSGYLFDSNWLNNIIKIATVPYVVTAVGAKPTGNYTIAGLIVTRVSGPNFDAAWVGKYIKLGSSLYFPISAVGGVSSLTITNPIGNTVPASGVWELDGSIGLTLQVTAGVQAAAAYVLPSSVYRLPNEGFITADFFVVPVFDAAQYSTTKIVLTGNVTSSYLANGVDGQIFTFIIQQDGTGARTFAFPANVFGATAIGATASKYSVQSFRKLGANWYAIAAGVINQG